MEWLGKIPNHWCVKRLGFECDAIVPMRDKPDNLDGEIPWVRIEDFDGKFISASKSGQGVSETTVQAMNLKVFPAGTVLCSCSCSMGATAIVRSPLVTNQTFIGINPRQSFKSEYLYFAFQAAAEHLNSIGTGAIQTYLSRDDFRQLRLPCPPTDEQEMIATFLDRETEKIDALVAEQRRLIELLREKRQAVISHAVTKGLDPNASLKTSGIERLHDLPNPYRVCKLSAVSDVVDPNPSHRNPEYVDEGFPFISTVEFGPNGYVEMETPRRVSEATVKEQENRCNFSGDSLAFSRKGTIGAVRRLPAGRFALLDSLCVINASKEVSVEFLLYLLESDYLRDQLEQKARGAALPQISVGEVRNLKIVLPDLEEQHAIVAFLASACQTLDALVQEAARCVELISERRSSLISAAVTGQIDVRQVAELVAA